MLLAPEPSAHGNLDTTSTSLVGWFLPRNAWLNSGYVFLYSLWRLLDEFPIFLRAGFTRILRSIHVLLSRVFSFSFLKARFEELNMDEVAALIVDNGSCMSFTGFC